MRRTAREVFSINRKLVSHQPKKILQKPVQDNSLLPFNNRIVIALGNEANRPTFMRSFAKCSDSVRLSY